MNIAHAGDRALLVELGDVSAGHLHGAAAAVRGCAGVIACIVGQTSLYVICERAPDVDMVRSAVSNASVVPSTGRTRRVAVSFRDEYGLDLVEFLATANISRDAFLDRVRDLRLVARYIGFRGGFAYLDGWPREWSMPRRPTSRPRVHRGTFAIGGSVAGFYPVDSPGGWNLLGRTAEPLEHALSPGDEIRIEPNLDEVASPPQSPVEAGDTSFPTQIINSPLVKIVTSADWSGIDRGICPDGPFDLEAAHLANRAVGNAPDAPVLECALAGPRLIARDDLICSWFGAMAETRVDGTVVADARQFQVRGGSEIVVGRISGGMRGYLAAGRSRGDVGVLRREDRLTIRAIAGPHQSRVDDLLCEVTPQLDRVGIRMRPIAPANLTAPANLPSYGMQFGTVQLHPDGTLVAMGPDHPVTGGYLQPMTVISSERWKLAQLVPGDRVRFLAQFSP